MTISGIPSARKKLERALFHAEALRMAVDAFRIEEPYEFDIKSLGNPQGESDIRINVTVSQAPPVPDSWPLITGDILTNVRASLDHAIYPHVREIAPHVPPVAHSVPDCRYCGGPRAKDSGMVHPGSARSRGEFAALPLRRSRSASAADIARAGQHRQAPPTRGGQLLLDWRFSRSSRVIYMSLSRRQRSTRCPWSSAPSWHECT